VAEEVAMIEGGEKRKAWVMAIGWENEEANWKGRESEAFKKAKKPEARVEICHVKFREF
jgi:hypothetical protein